MNHPRPTRPLDAHGRTGLRFVGGIGAIGVGWVVVALLRDPWRVAEAVVVRWVLRTIGFGDVDRVGHELLVTAVGGRRFSAAISPWCSTLVLVVGCAVAATFVRHGRRWRAFASASAILMLGNVARIVATVAVGVRRGPGAIEPFHDGPATWFAVLCTLAAIAVFGAVLVRGSARSGTVESPKSPQMEATTPGRL